MLIGLISDTHDLLRPAALDALRGSDVILHGGDICSPGILDTLRSLAPVHAVRGNCDCAPFSETLPWSVTLEFEGVKIHVVHILTSIEIDPAATGIRVIISGHSHRPGIREQKGILYVNPGSAGPRRFDLPLSVARLHLHNGEARAELVPI